MPAATVPSCRSRRGDFRIGRPMTPADGDYTGSCLPYGLTRSFNAPYPYQILQSDKLIAVLFELNTWHHVIPFADAASRRSGTDLVWTFDRPVGRRHAGRRHHRLQRLHAARHHRAPSQRGVARHADVHAHRCRAHRVHRHDRRSEDVHRRRGRTSGSSRCSRRRCSSIRAKRTTRACGTGGSRRGRRRGRGKESRKCKGQSRKLKVKVQSSSESSADVVSASIISR